MNPKTIWKADRMVAQKTKSSKKIKPFLQVENLTKKFGADQAHKFVNGVLDKLSKTLRAAETGQS